MGKYDTTQQQQDTPAEAGAPPPNSARLPNVIIPTSTYAFHQGLAYAYACAQSAPSLEALRDHLGALTADTAALVDAVSRAENAVVARVRAGMPSLSWQSGAARDPAAAPTTVRP